MITPFLGSPAAELEIAVATCLAQVTDNGFPFDVPGAQALLAAIEDHARELMTEMHRLMPPAIVEEEFIPKRNNKTKNYVKGVPVIRRKEVPFNVNSPVQVAERLRAIGWQPTIFTETGAPSTKAAVLQTLDYPEAKAIAGYKIDSKVQTMLSGEKGWLNTVRDDGRIHTSYRTMGTVTGRCSHAPNIAQIPKVQTIKTATGEQLVFGVEGHWGANCRSLFSSNDDWWLVGLDQQGLELRCLAHYLAAYDGGDYAVIACDNPHGNNADILNVSRAQAKTFVYAMIYGGGNYKLGTIIEPEWEDEYSVKLVGETARAALIDGITGFRELFDWLDGQNDQYIEGLDGRGLFVRKAHARLNTLLQAAGAIICKRWLVMTDDALQAHGLHHGNDYQIHAFVHDELQIGARTHEIAEIIAETGTKMAAGAGQYYNLQCPTAGEAHIGRNWATTH